MTEVSDSDVRPRRSALYMPGANPRALEKGRTLAADVVIMDVEDGVLPDAKVEARERIVAEIAAGGYAPREIIVRINGIGTEWFEDDIRAFAASGADALLVPKVDGPETVLAVARRMEADGAPADVGIWCMIETPQGVLNARETAAAHERLRAFTLGTADLSSALHAELHAPDRMPLLTSIGLVVLAARANGLAALDAPHFDLSDDAGFERVCRQGKSFGFDGKTLLHPKTIAVANEIYGPSAEEIAWSERVIRAWTEAAGEGKGVTLLDGKLIENLHVDEARRIIAIGERIAELARAAAG